MIDSSDISDFLNVLNLIDFEIHSQRLYPIIIFFFYNVYYNLEILLPLLIIILSKFSLALVKSKEFLLFLIFFTFFIFYIYALYISTAFPFDWHLATSFDRIFFHFMGIFSIFLYIFYFYENKNNKI